LDDSLYSLSLQYEQSCKIKEPPHGNAKGDKMRSDTDYYKGRDLEKRKLLAASGIKATMDASNAASEISKVLTNHTSAIE
jgi:hypothetical protein